MWYMGITKGRGSCAKREGEQGASLRAQGESGCVSRGDDATLAGERTKATRPFLRRSTILHISNREVAMERGVNTVRRDVTTADQRFGGLWLEERVRGIIAMFCTIAMAMKK